MRVGVDYYGPEPIASVKSVGASFVIRYLSDQRGKCLTAAEAKELSEAGIDIVCVWENNPDDVLGSETDGEIIATRAAAYMRDAGCIGARPIYVAVDIDAQGRGILPELVPFFTGFSRVVGTGRMGPYGGVGTTEYLGAHGLGDWRWQTSAWSYGVWDSKAQLRQIKYNVGAFDIDVAEVADFGQWRYGVNPPHPPVPNPLAPLLPAERSAVNKLEDLEKHQTPNAKKIKYQIALLTLMREAVWNAANKDGLTTEAWAKNNRQARFEILTSIVPKSKT